MGLLFTHPTMDSVSWQLLVDYIKKLCRDFCQDPEMREDCCRAVLTDTTATPHSNWCCIWHIWQKDACLVASRRSAV